MNVVIGYLNHFWLTTPLMSLGIPKYQHMLCKTGKNILALTDPNAILSSVNVSKVVW